MHYKMSWRAPMLPLKAIPGYDHILMLTMTMYRVQKA